MMTPRSPESSLQTNAIELSNISFTRAGNAILADVNLSVPTGSCCAILGPNGSGKSALMAVLSGYLWPSTGTVVVNGRCYGRVSLADVRRTIGLIEPSRAPQFSRGMCVREVVATGLFGTIVLPLHQEIEAGQWQRAEAELASLGLASIGDRAYGDLSSGEQMKTLLARAMVADAKILLFDEPTVGLDMGARAACIGVLDELMQRPDRPTMVIVSHHLDELPLAVSRVVLMKGGRLVAQGDPREMLSSEPLGSLFDCHVDVIENNGRFVASVRAAQE
jgi:iron complex transport system ATP-binding protein